MLGRRARNPMAIRSAIVTAFVWAITAEPASAVPLPVPLELAPGAKFQLVFVTTEFTPATSPDVTTYNHIAQNSANAAGLGAALGITWRAIVSTSTVNARDNAPVGASTPVYNMAKVRVADGESDMWDGSLAAAVGYHENGMAPLTDVWTGTVGGVGVPGSTLGNTDTTSFAWCGRPSLADNGWTAFLRPPLTSSFYLYALSSELTVPPTSDFDRDGDVDGADLLVWQRGVGAGFTGADLAAWRSDFGFVAGGNSGGAAAAVAEPASGALVAAAGLLLALSRRGYTRHR
jgi:hypothetical protein